MLPSTFQVSTKPSVISRSTSMRLTLWVMRCWYLSNVPKLSDSICPITLSLLLPESLVSEEGDQEVVVEEHRCND